MLSLLRKKAEKSAAGLPALIMDAQSIAASVTQGEHAKRRAGTGEKFWQFREYQAGDRPQDIDWRQSAKTDRIYIKQREQHIAQTHILDCATDESMDFSSHQSLPSKADTAKIFTLALSILLTNGGEQIGLLGDTRRGRSRSMVDYIGTALMDKSPSHLGARLPRHCSVIQIGDFLAPIAEIEAQLTPLVAAADSGLLIQVLDPAELDLPFDGRTVFEEPSNDHRQTIEHVGSIRDEYQSRLQAHLADIEILCRRHGWRYILHRTDGQSVETLNQIWGMLHVSGARI